MEDLRSVGRPRLADLSKLWRSRSPRLPACSSSGAPRAVSFSCLRGSCSPCSSTPAPRPRMCLESIPRLAPGRGVRLLACPRHRRDQLGGYTIAQQADELFATVERQLNSLRREVRGTAGAPSGRSPAPQGEAQPGPNQQPQLAPSQSSGSAPGQPVPRSGSNRQSAG